ncbi:hypothetical protein [Desertivirga brevis]|uniref:hypothetical protein n=1 Tax=Desertivirga brevis TaxID=2810310 RepID=UPI001A95C569|nr:hypothetical protein [Pedobacter sp. SYSU D00873]
MKRDKINGLSGKEIAEAFIIPQTISDEDKKLADAELNEKRKARRKQLSDEDRLKNKLLQLKFQLEDYLSSDKFDPRFRFSYFLEQYIQVLNKKKKDFALDVNVSEYQLSHYLNNRREPNESFIIRLEIHSNKFIPALQWFKLIEKEKEHDLISNQELRKLEAPHVSGGLNSLLNLV